MELKIVWSKKAINNYIHILQYIQNNFGDNAAKKYQQNFEELITHLTHFPALGSLQVTKEKIRGIILYRRTTIFYKYDKEKIFILNVIDNRMRV